MVIKENHTLYRFPELNPYHQIEFSVILTIPSCPMIMSATVSFTFQNFEFPYQWSFKYITVPNLHE